MKLKNIGFKCYNRNFGQPIKTADSIKILLFVQVVTKVIGFFPKCFTEFRELFVIIVKGLKLAAYCLSGKDATTMPTRHM